MIWLRIGSSKTYLRKQVKYKGGELFHWLLLIAVSPEGLGFLVLLSDAAIAVCVSNT